MPKLQLKTRRTSARADSGINLSDFYVIVHADESSTMKESKKIAEEIRRIRREEQHAEVQGLPGDINFKVPPHRKLLVCGFYHGKESWDERCVDIQIKALKLRGFKPELYLPATKSLKP